MNSNQVEINACRQLVIQYKGLLEPQFFDIIAHWNMKLFWIFAFFNSVHLFKKLYY